MDQVTGLKYGLIVSTTDSGRFWWSVFNVINEIKKNIIPATARFKQEQIQFKMSKT
jgi:hypothetical protein